MSWDVLVQNYGGNPPAADELADAPDPKPLGTADSIRKKIDAHLPGVVWSDARNGIFDGEDYSNEFEIGDEKPIDHVMLNVRGGGDAIAALVAFAKPNRWSLFDLSESDFLDLDNPSAAGWEGFQEFRDRAIPASARRRAEPALKAKRPRNPASKKSKAKPKGGRRPKKA